MVMSMKDFEIERTLARGSFGLVSLVRYIPDGTDFVMKMISTNDPKDKHATELEVQLLQTLNHPNIVGYRGSFMDIDSDGGGGASLCIVMEYCEQGDLFTHLQEEVNAREKSGMNDSLGSNIPEEKITEWLIQICWALDQLHAKKILHRDLKTQNIFLKGNRQKKRFALKLGDFGVAKVLNSSIDLAQTQIGTPFYMAPEVYRNKPYSYASDLWGLGCVLYEMITGNRAFDAQSLNGLALKVMRGKYSPVPKTCSPEMQLLVKSLFSQATEHRPSLKEVLCLPFVRKRLHSTLRSVVNETSHAEDIRAATQKILVDQVVGMGMGSMIGVEVPHDQACDESTIEKLEYMKCAREAEQRSLELLEQKSSELMAKVMKQPFLTPRPLGVIKEGVPGYASDRDRVIYYRDLEKQEALKRFETEAKGIREEARASREVIYRRCQNNTGSSADMWNALGQIAPRQEEEETLNSFVEDNLNTSTRGLSPPMPRIHEASVQSFYVEKSTKLACQEKPDFEPLPIGPQRDVVRPVVSPASQRPLAPLLWYDHIKEVNIQNPFSQINPKVVHSPVTKLRPGKRGAVGYRCRADGIAEEGEIPLTYAPCGNDEELGGCGENGYGNNCNGHMDGHSSFGENQRQWLGYDVMVQNDNDDGGRTSMPSSVRTRTWVEQPEGRGENESQGGWGQGAHPHGAVVDHDFDEEEEEEWSDEELSQYDNDYPGLQATLQAREVHKAIDRCQSAIAKQNMTLESLYCDLSPEHLADREDRSMHPRYKELEQICIKGLGGKLFEEALGNFRNGYQVDDLLGDVRGFVSIFEQLHHLCLH